MFATHIAFYPLLSLLVFIVFYFDRLIDDFLFEKRVSTDVFIIF